MTAPTSALTSGHGLRVLAPGQAFEAAFRIRINAPGPSLAERQELESARPGSPGR
jgi:hypothetical protein